MNKIIKNDSGFTIAELLIVILVIVILGLLVINNYSGIKAKYRNGARQKNITALQLNIEPYFSTNGYYPTLEDLNNPKWRAVNMKGLNPNNLVDPLSKCNPDSSACLSVNPKPKTYSYNATDSSGKNCDAVKTTCAKYTLTATYEGTVNGSHVYKKINVE